MSDLVDVFSSHLTAMRRMLGNRGCLTLVIRTPGDDENDIVVTADDLTEVRAVIDRTIARENAK